MATRKSIGLRLREARGALGWTQEQVASRLKIPRSRLALIELGQRPIDSTLLWRFADLYGQRLVDFLSEEPHRNPLTLLRGQALSAEAGAELQRLYAQAREQSELESRLGLDPPPMPSYELGTGRRAVDQGEVLAAQERNRLGLGREAPVGDVFDLLEHQGIRAFPLPCDDRLDGGFFYSQEVGPCVFLSVRKDGPAAGTEAEGAGSASENAPSLRWRFTVMHEYCHTLVDRELGATVCQSEAGRNRLPELRANAFASAFLMPRQALEHLAEELGRRRSQAAVTDVIHIMWHFRVSFEAVFYRLKNLGLGPEALTALGKAKGSILSSMLKLGYDPALADAPLGDWARGGYRRRLRLLAVEAYQRDLISLGKVGELLGLRFDDAVELLVELGVKIRT